MNSLTVWLSFTCTSEVGILDAFDSTEELRLGIKEQLIFQKSNTIK